MTEGLGPSPEEMSLGSEGDDDLTPREKREAEIDETVEQRRLEIQKTREEPTLQEENLTGIEKQKRAVQIAIDSIPTSRESKLKQQSEEARRKFMERLIAEFDKRGWTVPKNRFVISPTMNDNATEHDIERYNLINEIAAWAKEGTDLM